MSCGRKSPSLKTRDKSFFPINSNQIILITANLVFELCACIKRRTAGQHTVVRNAAFTYRAELSLYEILNIASLASLRISILNYGTLSVSNVFEGPTSPYPTPFTLPDILDNDASLATELFQKIVELQGTIYNFQTVCFTSKVSATLRLAFHAFHSRENPSS